MPETPEAEPVEAPLDLGEPVQPAFLASPVPETPEPEPVEAPPDLGEPVQPAFLASPASETPEPEPVEAPPDLGEPVQPAFLASPASETPEEAQPALAEHAEPTEAAGAEPVEAEEPEAEVAQPVAEPGEEELEELEEVEELESVPETEVESSVSIQAHALASREDEDIPLIPESSGLELVDETDVSELIAFIDVEEAEELEALESVEEELGGTAVALTPSEPESVAAELPQPLPAKADEEPLESLEPIEELEVLDELEPVEEQDAVEYFESVEPSEGVESVEPAAPVKIAAAQSPGLRPGLRPGRSPEPLPRDTGLEPLEEVEFELLLSSIDLSSLEQWERGPAGGAEADATRFDLDERGVAGIGPEEVEELEEEPLQPDEEAGEEVEAEELEALPLVDEDEPPAEAESPSVPAVEEGQGTSLEEPSLESDADLGIGRYLGPVVRYRPFAAFEFSPVVEELPVVGEGEPWSEAEFVGDFMGDIEDDNAEAPPPAAEEYGEAAEETFDEGGIIEFRDGVFRLREDLPARGSDRDPELRALVDSVLEPDQR
jgi:hypothetical protein